MNRCDYTTLQGLANQLIDSTVPNSPELLATINGPTGADPGATIQIPVHVQNIGPLSTGRNFPVEPGQAVTPGKVDAKGEASVTVRSLKSLEKDGKPYSDKMDDVMDEKMKMQEYPKIIYRLTELTLKEPAKSKDAPYVFEAKGDLAVAGVTNSITMPVNVLPMGEKKIKISGSTSVKMTQFKIEPPAPKMALGMIKTGDDVKIIFDWMVAPKTATASAAK